MKDSVKYKYVKNNAKMSPAPGEEQFKVYPSRWYILVIYSIFACLQVSTQFESVLSSRLTRS